MQSDSSVSLEDEFVRDLVDVESYWEQVAAPRLSDLKDAPAEAEVIRIQKALRRFRSGYMASEKLDGSNASLQFTDEALAMQKYLQMLGVDDVA